MPLPMALGAHCATRSTAKLVAKYVPKMPILSVVVSEIKIKTDSFYWSCSDESAARHALFTGGWFMFCVQDLQGLLMKNQLRKHWNSTLNMLNQKDSTRSGMLS
ncbi:unnamed protein product [Fraxinus pennsylvanica]|uniref:Uncharacterized protein n=1 Tax=Fraxinus pennsylvanica TaxID=56036 RepID=A0AAD1YY08_9LAMI|nr:unnamed protein product [Fraxinus pennsylvanica]